jgi:hypothetical protein
MQAQKDMFLHLVRGDGDSDDKHREFYDEYLAVMDLTAEFYMQTVDTVFVQHLMPRGLMTSRGRPIDLAAIRRPALMTVEGEKDDITGTGQCRAALDLCSGIPDENKMHFESRSRSLWRFNGSRFRSEIAPRRQIHARTRSLRHRQSHYRRTRAHGKDAAPWQQERGHGSSRLSFRRIDPLKHSRSVRFSRVLPGVSCRCDATARGAVCPPWRSWLPRTHLYAGSSIPCIIEVASACLRAWAAPCRGGTQSCQRPKRKTKTIGLEVHGITAPVEVQRHAGARRLTLRVSKTRRAVVVSSGAMPDGRGRRFLSSHIEWVRDRLGRVPEPVPFVDGAQIPGAASCIAHSLSGSNAAPS